MTELPGNEVELTNDEWKAYEFFEQCLDEGMNLKQARNEMLRLDSFRGMRANYRFLEWLIS